MLEPEMRTVAKITLAVIITFILLSAAWYIEVSNTHDTPIPSQEHSSVTPTTTFPGEDVYDEPFGGPITTSVPQH